MSKHFSMDYRKASQADVDHLAELRIKQLIDEGYPETTDIREDLKNYFLTSLEKGSLICWLGVEKEIIQATAAVCFYQLPPTFSNPSGRVAYITNLYTNDAYRKQGIASHLLSQLIVEARSLNYTSVRLHASVHGKGIYEKAGFTDTDGYMAMKV